MAKQENVMDRAFKGNEHIKQMMERTPMDTREADIKISKELTRAVEQLRAQRQERERERER
jgi:uncharacterized protein YidB (DUF937 family)